MGIQLGMGTSMEHAGGRIGTHNTWLLILVDSGIFPALLFLTFGLMWLVRAWRCLVPAIRVVALGYFLIFALAVLASHNTLTKRVENLTLGVVLGAIAADAEIRRRKNPRAKPQRHAGPKVESRPVHHAI